MISFLMVYFFISIKQCTIFYVFLLFIIGSFCIIVILCATELLCWLCILFMLTDLVIKVFAAAVVYTTLVQSSVMVFVVG